MKEYVHLLAWYNSKANAAMYQILVELSDKERKKEVGSYYHSLDGIIRHLYQSDLIWLTRISAGFPGLSASVTETIDRPDIELHENDDFSALWGKRKRADAILEKVTGEISSEQMTGELVYVDKRGNERRYILWQTLAHIFNHQTHHRGMVAEILDQMKVANDFSNIIWYIAPPQ